MVSSGFSVTVHLGIEQSSLISYWGMMKCLLCFSDLYPFFKVTGPFEQNLHAWMLERHQSFSSSGNSFNFVS